MDFICDGYKKTLTNTWMNVDLEHIKNFNKEILNKIGCISQL